MTAQGFLRADGYAARVGIYEYRGDNGKTSYELRPREEVFHPDSLASYQTAPITINHPTGEKESDKLVSADNVKKLEVGTVMADGREDGDYVAIDSVIKDARAIKLIQGGTQELSPGNRIDLDETPGYDPRYATSTNPLGRYDAVQRNIRVNHIAIVKAARGGSQVRLRMDEADSVRADGDVDLTSIEAGHQHSINTCGTQDGCGYTPWGGPISRDSGCTSWAVSAGADDGHQHDWVRNADGTITLAMSQGHTHTIIEDDPRYAPSANGMPIVRSDHQIDRSNGVHDSGRMTTPPTGSAPAPDAAEQIRLLTVRADAADRVAGERNELLATTRRDSDALRAQLATAVERVAALEAQLRAGSAVVETQAVHEQRTRADSAERELSQLRAAQPALIRRRAGLVAKAGAVLGPEFRADGLNDREILIAGIRRLRPKEPTGPEVTDEYLASRFDSLVDDRTEYGASLGRASETLQVRRVDSLPAPVLPAQVPWADRWKLGAGQFATRKDG